MYKTTNRLLQSLNVEYWLVYGTLLGYYREGGIIAWDRDIDFGAHEKEFLTIWQARHSLPDGFVMHDTSADHYGPKLYVAYKGWEADIYFYKDAGEQLQCYEKSRNIGDMQPFPRQYVYPLQTVRFLGETTRIPNDAEAWLRHTYGYIGADAARDPHTGYWHQKTDH